MNSRGFTFFHLVILIFILMVLSAAALVPMVRQIELKRKEITLQRIEDIKIAIFGDGRIRGYESGFLFDMERLPETLEELIVYSPKDMPEKSQGNAKGVEKGNQGQGQPHSKGQGGAWNGPYLKTLFAEMDVYDLLTDAWGKPLVYDAATGEVKSINLK